MLKNTSNILQDGNGHKFHVSVIAYNNYGTFTLQHPPSWQAQNTAHERVALLQPHLDELQGVPLWHPHLMSFRTESGARFTASGIVVGTSDLLTSSFFHPYFQRLILVDLPPSQIARSMFDDEHVSRFPQRPQWWEVESTILVRASLRHGRAGPLPRAPHFEGASRGLPRGPADPALCARLKQNCYHRLLFFLCC